MPMWIDTGCSCVVTHILNIIDTNFLCIGSSICKI